MNGSAWKLFDRVAADYDEVVPFFASFGAAIMVAIDPPAGCRFLDLGAGRGALTASALARGCEVTAVDAAPGMVQHLAAAYPDAEAHHGRPGADVSGQQLRRGRVIVRHPRSG